MAKTADEAPVTRQEIADALMKSLVTARDAIAKDLRKAVGAEYGSDMAKSDDCKLCDVESKMSTAIARAKDYKGSIFDHPDVKPLHEERNKLLGTPDAPGVGHTHPRRHGDPNMPAMKSEEVAKAVQNYPGRYKTTLRSKGTSSEDPHLGERFEIRRDGGHGGAPILNGVAKLPGGGFAATSRSQYGGPAVVHEKKATSLAAIKAAVRSHNARIGSSYNSPEPAAEKNEMAGYEAGGGDMAMAEKDSTCSNCGHMNSTNSAGSSKGKIVCGSCGKPYKPTAKSESLDKGVLGRVATTAALATGLMSSGAHAQGSKTPKPAASAKKPEKPAAEKPTYLDMSGPAEKESQFPTITPKGGLGKAAPQGLSGPAKMPLGHRVQTAIMSPESADAAQARPGGPSTLQRIRAKFAGVNLNVDPTGAPAAHVSGGPAPKPTLAAVTRTMGHRMALGEMSKASYPGYGDVNPEKIQGTLGALRARAASRNAGRPPQGFDEDPTRLVDHAVNQRGGEVRDPHSVNTAQPNHRGSFPRKATADYQAEQGRLGRDLNSNVAVHPHQAPTVMRDIQDRLTPGRVTDYEGNPASLPPSRGGSGHLIGRGGPVQGGGVRPRQLTLSEKPMAKAYPPGSAASGGPNPALGAAPRVRLGEADTVSKKPKTPQVPALAGMTPLGIKPTPEAAADRDASKIVGGIRESIMNRGSTVASIRASAAQNVHARNFMEAGNPLIQRAIQRKSEPGTGQPAAPKVIANPTRGKPKAPKAPVATAGGMMKAEHHEFSHVQDKYPGYKEGTAQAKCDHCREFKGHENHAKPKGEVDPTAWTRKTKKAEDPDRAFVDAVNSPGRCPHCKSTDVNMRGSSLATRDRNRTHLTNSTCQNCGTKWQFDHNKMANEYVQTPSKKAEIDGSGTADPKAKKALAAPTSSYCDKEGCKLDFPHKPHKK